MQIDQCVQLCCFNFARLPSGYIIARPKGRSQKWKSYYLHRLIMRPQHGMQVDHINGDRSDNRRSNLRICTNQQNNLNKTGTKSSTGVRGVYPVVGVPGKPFRASFRNHYLGCFATIHEASAAYQTAMRAFAGAFAP